MAIQPPTVADEYGLEEVNDDGISEVTELTDGNQLETQVQEQAAQQQMAQVTPGPSTVEGTQEEEGVNLLEEAASVVGGGAIDAVESVGGFAELTGDTLKTGLNQLFGRPLDQTQNPFSENYKHSDANWLNIPDVIYDKKGNVLWEDSQPKTAIGKFGRGLVEFGILSAGTGFIGGTAFRATAVGQSIMGVGAKGGKTIQFIRKGVKIGSEGAIADLISTSSEHANIMNLATEHIPWAVPIIGNMVAIQPEDNPWEARFKTIVSGAGMNFVAHGIGALYKGFWKAGREKLAGATDEAANAAGNKHAAEEFVKDMQADELAHENLALQEYSEGIGKNRSNPWDEFARKWMGEEYDEYRNKLDNGLDEDAARVQELEDTAKARGEEGGDLWDEENQINSFREADDLGREQGPYTNSDKYTRHESTADGVKDGAFDRHIRESINDAKDGGSGSSYTNIVPENQLRAMARGDQNIYQYIKEVADDLANSAFKVKDNNISWDDVRATIIKQASDTLDIIEGGGDLGKSFREALVDPNDNRFRLYGNGPDNTVLTISPTQKAANVLVMNALGKRVQAIAQGSLTIADGSNISAQAAKVFDNMQVILKENKKMGMMWGLDGKAQQEFVLAPTMLEITNKKLAQIDTELDEYFDALRGLVRNKQWSDLEDLMELHNLSGGSVRTLDHIHEYLKAKIYGGRMDDIHIKGGIRKGLQSTFFNSVLSSWTTPIKAFFGTNMIAIMRPLQAYMGAALMGDPKQMFIASSQMQDMGRAFAESIQMGKHNWDLGVKRKGQTYQGKFDVEADIKSWKDLKRFYENHGSPSEKIAYGALDKVVDFNNSPLVKYSVNAMGAGDAAARTIIGRQYMRQRAATAAWDMKKANSLLSDKDLMKIAIDSEEQFRDQIFKQDVDGKWVVSDKGAGMAGDYAAMTRTLQENFKGFELISNIPGMKAFFPFVRTGFNYLDVTFDHTPLGLFKDKYRDLTNPKGPRNLEKYGIRPEDADYEVALMKGRVAMGTSVTGLAILAALQGRMTGDYPVDKRDRDLWKANNIQPRSFKVGNKYVSYDKIEIFNTLFALTANIAGYSDVLGEKATDQWIKKAAFMTSAVIVDQSMLSGVEDLARLMNPRSAEDLLLKTGSRYFRSHLPYAGLLGQLGDVMDSNQKEANTFWELASKRDVAFKSMLPPKYDILSKDRSGKPLIYGPENPMWRLLNSISPIAVTDIQGDEVKEALFAIRFNLPQEMSTYLGEPLNSVEQSALSRELATGGLRRDLERIIRDPAFKRTLENYKKGQLKESDGWQLKDQVFYSAISRSFRFWKKDAMQRLLANNNELSAKIINRQRKRRLSKTGQTDQIEYLTNEFPK